MHQHWPLIEVAVEPRRPSDRARMLAALVGRASDEMSLHAAADDESGQVVLGGANELQLDGEVDRLRREHGIDLMAGDPHIVHRETVTRRVELDYTCRNRSGSPVRFARVKIVVEPNAAGGGNLFASSAALGAFPVTYVPAVRDGVARALRAGVLEGRPVLDVSVTLVDGACHDRDSSTSAFSAAGLTAGREALAAAGPVLLEPVMAVEVMAWGAGAGAVADDLQARGAEVRIRPPRDERVIVDALVPLAAMLGYAVQLRSLTGGLSHVEMLFDHHRPVPPPDEPRPTASAAAMRA